MSNELTLDQLEVGKTYVTVEIDEYIATLIEPVWPKDKTAIVYYAPKSRLVLDYTHFDESIRFVEIKA